MLDHVQAVDIAAFFRQRLAIAVVDIGARREIRVFGQARSARHAIEDIHGRPGDLPAAFLNHAHYTIVIGDLAKCRRVNHDIVIDDGGPALMAHGMQPVADASEANDAVRLRELVNEALQRVQLAAARCDQAIHRLEILARPGVDESSQDIGRFASGRLNLRGGGRGSGRDALLKQRRFAGAQAQQHDAERYRKESKPRDHYSGTIASTVA